MKTLIPFAVLVFLFIAHPIVAHADENQIRITAHSNPTEKTEGPHTLLFDYSYDRPVSLKLFYGKTVHLGSEFIRTQFFYRTTFVITGLEPNTKYFYRMLLTDEQGNTRWLSGNRKTLWEGNPDIPENKNTVEVPAGMGTAKFSLEFPSGREFQSLSNAGSLFKSRTVIPRLASIAITATSNSATVKGIATDGSHLSFNKIRYGVTSADEFFVSTSNVIGGLEPKRTYLVVGERMPLATDHRGVTTRVVSFTTPAEGESEKLYSFDALPPNLLELEIHIESNQTAALIATLDVAGMASLRYGTDNNLEQSLESSEIKQSHTFSLSGLSTEKTYAELSVTNAAGDKGTFLFYFPFKAYYLSDVPRPTNPLSFKFSKDDESGLIWHAVDLMEGETDVRCIASGAWNGEYSISKEPQRVTVNPTKKSKYMLECSSKSRPASKKSVTIAVKKKEATTEESTSSSSTSSVVMAEKPSSSTSSSSQKSSDDNSATIQEQLKPLQSLSQTRSLSKKFAHVNGRILLAVQQAGEAWYVHPKTSERTFLGRPDDAFAIMRKQGVGISNRDLSLLFGIVPSVEKELKVKDSAMARKLAGSILLQVERNGESYYLDPTNMTAYFLGRPSDAFRIMRNRGLGITNEDLLQVMQPDS